MSEDKELRNIKDWIWDLDKRNKILQKQIDMLKEKTKQASQKDWKQLQKDFVNFREEMEKGGKLQYIEDWIRRLDKKDRDIQKQVSKIRGKTIQKKTFKRNLEQLKIMVKKYKNVDYFAENFEKFRKEMLKENLEEKRNFEELRKDFVRFKKEVLGEILSFIRNK